MSHTADCSTSDQPLASAADLDSVLKRAHDVGLEKVNNSPLGMVITSIPSAGNCNWREPWAEQRSSGTGRESWWGI